LSASLSHVILPDGRRLGYAEHGDPTGIPLLFFPGTPHSRLCAPNDASWIAQQGIRFVTVERPGFGISDWKPQRTLLDWPADVACLADALHLGTFFLAGTSGGGPYVAVCAHAMPERLRACAIVAGFGCMSETDATSGMAWSRKLGARLLRAAPGSIERIGAVLPLHRRPEWIYGVMARAMKAEAPALARDWDERMKDVREALRPGMRGFLRELRIATGDWGFRLEDVRARVHVWHGDADEATPIAMGRAMAARIPNARAHFIAGAGHLLWRTHQEEIIRELLAED
jgi:pimeloyl-ACP methyl ester carboxylesterase